MKIKIHRINSVAHWRWNLTPSKDPNPSNSTAEQKTAQAEEEEEEDEEDEDVCGICRVPFDGCCPDCKRPGDDCPLIWGVCTHVFHMHCLYKWLEEAGSKGQCPMDRRVWETAARNAG